MAARRRKVTFPENIHRVAADIRRQALRHPDRDPVVPGETRTAAKRTAKKRPATRTTAARKKTSVRRGK